MQTARMIEWLDEERRRDKNTIAQMQERLNQQAEVIEQLRRHVNGVEDEVSAQKTQFMPVNRDQELMSILRKEFDEVVESMEAKRLTAEREGERRAEVARESIVSMIRKVEERQGKAEETFRDVMNARSERERLSAALAAMQARIEDLGKKIEEPERRLTLIEEQRRQDGRRLSDIQATMPEMRKDIESINTKLDLVEGLTKSNEKRMIDMQNGESERREEIQQFLDQQNLMSQQRDQQVKDLRDRVSAYDDDMRRNMERFEAWAETHRQMKKVVEDFERIGERLERRINEVAEMQRLSEERFRTEWNDWIEEDQLRWREFTVSNDESWRTHGKEMQDLREQLRQTSIQIEPVQKNVDRAWKLLRAQAELYRERYQALLLEYDASDERESPSGGQANANL